MLLLQLLLLFGCTAREKRRKRRGKMMCMCMQQDVVKSATSQPANQLLRNTTPEPLSPTTMRTNPYTAECPQQAFTHPPTQPTNSSLTHLDTRDRCVLPCNCWSPADSTSGDTNLVVLPLEWRVSLPDLSSPLAAAAVACRRLRLRLHRNAPRAASRSTPARMRGGVFA